MKSAIWPLDRLNYCSTQNYSFACVFWLLHPVTLVTDDPFMASLPQFEEYGQQTVKTTTCYMCACRCGIEVKLEG